MSNQFWLPKPYAQTKRLKSYVTESALRVYPNDPDTTLLQTRVRAKNRDAYGAGTITNIILSVTELKQLRAYLDTEITRIEGRTRIVVARSPQDIARERGTS